METADQTCELCGVSIVGAQSYEINGHQSCQNCAAQIHAELTAKQAGAGSAPLGLVGALIGGALGAAAWAGITIATEYEIGYVAVLVGWLAGQGAVLFTGGGHGPVVQLLAVLGALAGVVGAKYALFAHGFMEYVEAEYDEVLGWFDAEIIDAFPDAILEMSDVFDILWVVLAVLAAWRAPASPQMSIEAA
jgi:hypothetical protein